jgi:hypothetical protein
MQLMPAQDPRRRTAIARHHPLRWRRRFGGGLVQLPDKAAPASPERERLTQLVQRVLRHPEQARDIEIDRAAARLMAARSNTPQLLLQHVLVLKAALQQIQQQHGLGATLPPTAVRPDAPAAGTPIRATVPVTTGFLRDTAVLGTGVLGGSLIFHGLASAFEGSSPDTVGAAEDADTDLGLDIWG